MDLNTVVKETLRLHPFTACLDGVSKASEENNGLTVPEGTVISVPVHEPGGFRLERCSTV